MENEEERILFAWRSLERVKTKKSRDYYSTIVVLAVLVGVIFFFIEGLMPVLLVAAILFVVFALSKAEPREVEHEISNRGIMSAGTKYLWEGVMSCWFEKKMGETVLMVLLARGWPSQLMLVLPQNNEKITEEKVRNEIKKYVVMEKPEETRMDKLINWFNKKIPLE